jgi:hypothetical protein
MAGSEIFSNAGNPYLVDYAPSLAENKTASLAALMVEKEKRLAPAPVVSPLFNTDTGTVSAGLAGGGENYWDVAQSSVYQAGSHLYDIVSDTDRTNQEILELSDAKAGLSAQGRERMVTAPQQLVADELGQGNYWEAAKKLPGAALGTIADSAGSVAEIGGTAAALAVGTAAAPAIAGAVGLAALGKKLYSGVKVADKVVDAVDTAKKAGIVAKTANVTKAALKAAPKAAAQVSVATADMTQRQVNTYQENFGEAPSTERVIGMYASNLGTMIFQPGIVKGLFVPAFKKQIKGEIKDIAKNLVKGSNMVKLGSRVGSGIVKVGAAGLAEGTQEYMQSWVEVLNTQLGPEDTGKFIEAVSREIGDKDNQLQALLGGYLGTAAGAGIRSATTVPAVAAGGAVDLTKATAKGTVKVASKVAGKVATMATDSTKRASYKLLSEEERTVLRETDARDKVVADQKVEGLQTRIDTIDKASSIDDLMADPVLASKVKEIAGDNTTTEELAQPKMLTKIKAKLIAETKGEQGIIKTAAYSSEKARLLSKVGSNVADAVSTKAKKLLKDVPVEQIVESVKDMSEKSVAAVKGIRSSTARGVIELGMREGMKSSNTIVAAAKDMEVTDLKKVVTVLTENNPELGAKLKKTYDAKVKALKEVGQLNDKDINAKTVDVVLQEVAASSSVSNNQAASVFSKITEAVNGKITDIAALDIVEAAVTKYKESESFKSGENKASMDVLDRRLAKQSKKLNNSLVQQAKDKSAEVVSKITEKGVLPYIKDTVAASKIADLLDTNPTIQEFKTKAKELIAKLPDLKGMPDITTPEGMAEFDASVEKAYNASTEAVTSAAKVVKDAVVGKDAEPSELYKGLQKTLKGTDAAVTALDEESREGILSSSLAPELVSKLKNIGLSTLSEVQEFLSSYPVLSKSATIDALIKKEFPSENENTFNEEASDAESVSAMTEVKAKELYNKVNPAECRI